MIDPAILEPLADDAWPARERDRLGGWRLNASSGRSMRINACWPLGARGFFAFRPHIPRLCAELIG